MMAPRDFDIFSPLSMSSHPWPKTVFGRSSPADISMAGQITAWNLVMSLPTMCTSAGHTRPKAPSSAPNPTAVM